MTLPPEGAKAQGRLRASGPPVTFVVSLFNDHVNVYEVHNSGNLYNLGYVLGLGFIVGGSSAGRRG